MGRVPPVNLHGDAHLEQYAVTDSGAGLADFDDAAVGPAVIDLVRFGVSLRLAGEVLGWSEAEQGLAWAAFIGGYRGALQRGGQGEHKSPLIVKQIQESFGAEERVALLGQVEALMEEVSFPLEAFEEAFEAAFDGYAALSGAQAGKGGTAFYKIKKIGQLKTGIGSALDQKFLLRVEGEGPSHEDDLILEAKELRDLSGIPCIVGAQNRGPLRILVGQARIANQPQAHLGVMRWKEKDFWIHPWEDHYREMSILGDGLSAEDWRALAEDVGTQLGLGHPKQIASPLDEQLRQALLQWLAERGPFLEREVRALTKEVLEAWGGVRAQLNMEMDKPSTDRGPSGHPKAQ